MMMAGTLRGLVCAVCLPDELGQSRSDCHVVGCHRDGLLMVATTKGPREEGRSPAR